MQGQVGFAGTVGKAEHVLCGLDAYNKEISLVDLISTHMIILTFEERASILTS